jgi:hypothetical protein
MIDVVHKERQGLDPRLQEIVERERAEDKDLVYCGACSHVIARKADGQPVNGSHAHHFTNPYGIHFHVGCYAEALGCTISGQPTAADSWFPGFFWRLASCAECQNHLGWYFERPGEHFYGLILDRIQHD